MTADANTVVVETDNSLAISAADSRTGSGSADILDLERAPCILPASAGEAHGVRLRCLGKVVRYGKTAEIAATLERYEFVRLTKLM